MNDADRALTALRAAREKQYAAWLNMRIEELRAEVAKKRITDWIRDGGDAARSPARNQQQAHIRQADRYRRQLQKTAAAIAEAELTYSDIVSQKPKHGEIT